MNMPVVTLLLTFPVLFSVPVAAEDCEYLPSPPDAGSANSADIESAWYGGATDRYAHGVLGDSIEATTLYVKHRDNTDCALAFTLDEQRVFEDVTPRIADVTGDGRDNIIAIESHTDHGAALAIYGIQNDELVRVTGTPPIGTRYRWLAPIGSADFNGDDIQDVAYIETPHLAGVLQIWSFADGQARKLVSKAGFSNHRIGENTNTGGVVQCHGRPRIVVPDVRWSRTMTVEFTNDILIVEQVANDTNRETISQHLACR